MLTRVVRIAMTRILSPLRTIPLRARPATCTLHVPMAALPQIRAATSCPPTMTLTTDQPMQAATLKSAMILAPTQPKEKREMVIWRSPSLGPSVEKKATGRTPSALKRMMTARLSQNPRPKTTLARAPRATVEITRLAESHMVKLSRMRTCVRVVGETRSIPCVSTPYSSGMVTTSVAIVLSSCKIVGERKHRMLLTQIDQYYLAGVLFREKRCT